ncbi:NAD(P)-dependent alcohol dehydrogenase [Anaerolineales bacterium]
MKAFVFENYGSPDHLKRIEIAKPIPKADQILVKIMATSLNSADWRSLNADPFLIRFTMGLRKPKKNTILGADFSGIVESIGENVTQFKIGDEVFGDLADHGFGAFAEYALVPEKLLSFKPNNLNFEESAALPLAAGTAFQGLKKVNKVQKGQKILIYGASGGVGNFAIQIAKAFGAEVTAVCSSKKIAAARSSGADKVIDYKQVDVTKAGQLYDVIIAVNGYHWIGDYKKILTTQGTCIIIGGSMKQIFQGLLLGPFMSMGRTKKISSITAKADQDSLLALKELAETGKIVPVIDACYPFEQLPEAFRYMESSQAKGKIVIRMTS